MTQTIQNKVAFVESLPTLAGLSVGYGPGRSVAGETAALIAPKGRVERSENWARNAAVIGAPIGGLVAMGLARRHRLAPRLGAQVAKAFPEGLIAEPAVEEELVRLGVPGVSAIGGSLLGGAATGAGVGGLQRLRGSVQNDRDKVAALKPSPMWSRIGGASSRRPLWMAQSGFTPTGFKTPAQRLSKSMDMGKVDGSKGLKPLDLGKMQQAVQAQAMGKTAEVDTEYWGPALLAITKVATGQLPPRQQKPKRNFSLADSAKMLGGGAGVQLSALANEELVGSMKAHARREIDADVGGELMKRVHESSPVHVTDLGSFPGNPTAYVPEGTKEIEALYTQHPQLLDPEAVAKNFKPSDRHILLGEIRSPSALAHEMGHADWDTSRVGRVLQNKHMHKALHHIKGPGSLAIGAAGGFSDDPLVQGATMGGAAALQAPLLINEGMANIKGYQRLKQLGASPEALGRARGTLGRAMGTYGTAALVPLGGALVGQGLIHGLRHTSDKPKTASHKEPLKREREDAETGDEIEPPIGKEAEDLGGQSFSTNQYSGVMNPPSMRYASGIPGWVEPPVKTAGPPPEREKKAMGITPAARLNSTAAIGAPRVTPAPGPSIAQISKPKGFGMPMSGAKKGNNTI